jgi:hypothetical protein
MRYITLVLGMFLMCSCTPSVHLFESDKSTYVESYEDWTPDEMVQELASRDSDFWKYMAGGTIAFGIACFAFGLSFGVSKLNSICIIAIGVFIYQAPKIMETVWFEWIVGVGFIILMLDAGYIAYVKSRDYLLDKNKNLP